MGNAWTMKQIAQTADVVLREFKSKSGFGKFFSSLSAPANCKQDDRLDEYMSCQLNSSQRDVWEVVLILFMILLIIAVIVLCVCAFKIKSYIKNRRTSNTNINLNAITGRIGSSERNTCESSEIQALRVMAPVLSQLAQRQEQASQASKQDVKIPMENVFFKQ